MASSKLRAMCQVVQRKKVYDVECADNNLRCLTQWDLAALGSGSVLGVGLYVLVGYVTLNVAGPSIIISFLIAALVAYFAGLSYAEFAVRIPKAGSSYNYTYAVVGELAAFMIGWNIILEAIFGTASVARGLSGYVDSMANGSMSTWFQSFAPINNDFFSTHFDFLSFFLVLMFGAIMTIGVKEAAMMNRVFAIINMAVICFIILVGAFKADANNWRLEPAAGGGAAAGAGGFFPFGAAGTLRGAAYCFYGFVGFEAICNTAEEVEKPRRTIPIAIFLTITVACLSYVGVSIVVTMMVPYYEHDPVASVAMVFSAVGWEWARWIVAIGAIFGICASLFGALFPLPRVLRAMAADALPGAGGAGGEGGAARAAATLAPAVVIAIIAGTFTLEQLLLTLCVGTLASYTVVSTCVIILRYESDEFTTASYVRQIFGFERTTSRTTLRIIAVELVLYACACLGFALAGARAGAWAALVAAATLMLLMVLQPRGGRAPAPAFSTPLVPVVPCISIFFNIYLMTLIDSRTWIRVAIWVFIGILVYLLCLCFRKKDKDTGHLEGNVNEAFSHVEMNGKVPVQIIVEEPTPPSAKREIEEPEVDPSRPLSEEMKADIQPSEVKVIPEVVTTAAYTEETIEQQAVIDQNGEREAKIIDLLDQVLQAEEDSFGAYEEIIVSSAAEGVADGKSLSEMSDAGSEASASNAALSHNVIAQVHREDLPKVNEEHNEDESNKSDEGELVTFFNESDSASRTDESGYSDTTDQNQLHESTEELKNEPEPYIPPPPPLNEEYFSRPAYPIFKKSYTISSRPVKPTSPEADEENKPRESVQSNSSCGEDTIVFGSARQMSFASKLSGILQKNLGPSPTPDRVRMRRSSSVGSLSELPSAKFSDRPSMLIDLHKEIRTKNSAQLLRPIPIAVHVEKKPAIETVNGETKEDEKQENSMNRAELKSKLESIFATGGTQLVKPRLMKSNPPTPEDNSVTENIITKVTKADKSDTLKLQKAKFGEVLNSFRLSINQDDQV